jgi:hypothetical protein
MFVRAIVNWRRVIQEFSGRGMRREQKRRITVGKPRESCDEIVTVRRPNRSPFRGRKSFRLPLVQRTLNVVAEFRCADEDCVRVTLGDYAPLALRAAVPVVVCPSTREKFRKQLDTA